MGSPIYGVFLIPLMIAIIGYSISGIIVLILYIKKSRRRNNDSLKMEEPIIQLFQKKS